MSCTIVNAAGSSSSTTQFQVDQTQIETNQYRNVYGVHGAGTIGSVRALLSFSCCLRVQISMRMSKYSQQQTNYTTRIDHALRHCACAPGAHREQFE
jgi:hypothetical protein